MLSKLKLNMNINPDKWGKPAWTYMMAIAYAYPENPTDEEQNACLGFFSAQKYLLPCKRCKKNCCKHYATNCQITKDVVKHRDNLINWLIDLKNEVNLSQGKPIMTHVAAKQYWDSYFTEKESTWPINFWLYLLLLFVISVSIILFFRCRNQSIKSIIKNKP